MIRGASAPEHLKTTGPIRGRFAPTPSGFLHLGNGVNFLLVWLLIRREGGTIKLRIDDADPCRVRPEFIEDIFRQLEWLRLDWDEGPIGPDDFKRHHSQLLRVDRYRKILARLTDHLFACICSRADIRAGSTSGLYPGTCRGRTSRPTVAHALRMRVPEETVIEVDGDQVALSRRLGDFVLWRKDDLPAYQLASLVDDLDDRINLIVRGIDLLESSAAQLFLARRLAEVEFQSTRFIHHPLLAAPGGGKLSKSDQSLSLAAMRSNGASPTLVYREAARLLGLNPALVGTLDDLVTGLQTAA